MSKLVYKSTQGYEMELDISSAMRRAIHDKNPLMLEESFAEFKRMIVADKFTPRFKPPKPWFIIASE